MQRELNSGCLACKCLYMPNFLPAHLPEIFETGSFTVPRARHFGWSSWPARPQDLPVFTHVTSMCFYMPAFYVAEGILTQVRVVQAPSPLNTSPALSLLFSFAQSSFVPAGKNEHYFILKFYIRRKKINKGNFWAELVICQQASNLLGGIVLILVNWLGWKLHSQKNGTLPFWGDTPRKASKFSKSLCLSIWWHGATK